MEIFTKLYEAIMNIFKSFISEDNTIFASIKEFFDGIFAKGEEE